MQELMMEQNSKTNTLRIGARQLEALLNKLDEKYPEKSNPARGHVRWDFRVVKVDLTVEHTSGSKVVLPVASRNISKGGISVLHSSFIYTGTHVHVSAELENGQHLDADGIVMRCTHIGGKVHEIGIKFEEEISTKELLGLDLLEEAYSLEHIPPEALHGNVIIVSADELNQKILYKLCEETSLQISISPSVDSALRKAKKGCDLILTDLYFGDEEASDLLMTLRTEGVDEPVLVMTSDVSDSVRDEMRMVGASGLISKPFNQEKLFRAFAEFLMGDADGGPIYTSLDQTSPAHELVGPFLNDLSRTVLNLEKALRESDTQTCRTICQSLSSSAAPLGFEAIGEHAVRADRSLASDAGVRDAAADIRQLIIACRRVRAKPNNAA